MSPGGAERAHVYSRITVLGELSTAPFNVLFLTKTGKCVQTKDKLRKD